MDFALLPPEINSSRLYSGVGSGPMMAAATAWDGLATQLGATAASYQMMLDELAGQWLGPSSGAMAASVAPYVEWMHTAAAHAAGTAAQARAAASAYEAAHAATVPPPVVAANRAQLASLVATNVLGQNIPAIAATETHYDEMWSQDAAAMYGYAGNSASAATLYPLAPPKNTASPAGLASQPAAAAQSAGSQGISAVPQALQGLAAPMQAGAPSVSTAVELLAAPLTALSTLVSVAGLPTLANAPASFTSVGFSATSIATARRGMAINADRDFDQGVGPFYGEGHGAAMLPQWVTGDVASPTQPPPAAAPSPMSAGMGQASTAGRLSVPRGWTSAAPAMRNAVAATGLPTAGAGAAPTAVAGASGRTFSDMALAGMAGRALGSTMGLSRREGDAAASDGPAAPGRTGGVHRTTAAELREFTDLLGKLVELRDAGALTEAEFNEQKQRFLGGP